MIEIVFLACAIANPADCKDVRLNFMADHVTPQQCMMYGQHEIAKWSQGHPKWKVKKWRCGTVKEQVAKAVDL